MRSAILWLIGVPIPIIIILWLITDEDLARKAASYTSLWIAFSLLFGAIVAVFSAITARIEDDRESIGASRVAP